MNRVLTLLALLLLLSVTAYAQDVDFGAFGDPGSLLTPVAPAARGTAPARGGATPAPPPDRLVRLRDVLTKAEAPLTREQETELNKLLDTEIPAMRRTLQTHGQQLMAERQANAPPAAATPAAPPPSPPAALSPQAPPAGGTPNAALLAAALAARGAPPSSRVPAEVLDALEVEMRQMNDALFGKVASSPALNDTQQSVLTKMARTQIRSRGGFDALRITLEDANAPLTEEQVPKVKAVFEEQKTARAAFVKQSQGTPDPATLKQLERDALTKVVGLLIPAQRTALLALLRAQQ
jgi:hypothetical protein